MRPSAANTLARARWSAQPSSASITGRAAAYRRISTASTLVPSAAFTTKPYPSPSSLSHPPILFLRSRFLPQDVLFRSTSPHTRTFSSYTASREQAQKHSAPDPKDPRAGTQSRSEQPAPSEGTAGNSAGGQGKEQSTKNKADEENAGEQEEGEEGRKKKDKDEKPPPPPHGDKTPWQVFTETLKTEFQASKEWNEGTKQLSGSVHDFTQNPRVQKATETYTKVTGAAKTTTAEALKTTAKAVGTGAAWTWETAPVKGVRKVANVTGSGIEYVTRPVRQSKAFQAVKETVDDGSSSRYGGWIEKEERRKRRELRELNELQRTGGRRPEGPLEEDPK